MLVCHTGNCIFLRDDLKNKISYEKNLLDDPDILFDKSWLNKKDSFLKKILRNLLPDFVIDFAKKVKRMKNLY